jgi:dihydrofolate reductase
MQNSGGEPTRSRFEREYGRVSPHAFVPRQRAGLRGGRGRESNAAITLRKERCMKSQRRIVAHLAVSADGYIARPDGDVEWLNRRARSGDYGMRAFYRSIDTILIGRKTYDWSLDYYQRHALKGSPFDRKMKNYVFSRNPPGHPEQGVEFVSEPLESFATKLRTAKGKHIWMMGGGDLIASFLDAGEIDEFDLRVIPAMIGEGIPIVAPRHRDISLKLLHSKKYPDGVVRLHYWVGARARARRQPARRRS